MFSANRTTGFAETRRSAIQCKSNENWISQQNCLKGIRFPALDALTGPVKKRMNLAVLKMWGGEIVRTTRFPRAGTKAMFNNREPCDRDVIGTFCLDIVSQISYQNARVQLTFTPFPGVCFRILDRIQFFQQMLSASQLQLAEMDRN